MVRQNQSIGLHPFGAAFGRGIVAPGSAAAGDPSRITRDHRKGRLARTIVQLVLDVEYNPALEARPHALVRSLRLLEDFQDGAVPLSAVIPVLGVVPDL